MKPPYRTRIEDVPLEQGLRADEGWIDDVLLIWGWSGAGSLAAAGYHLPEERA